ncbi:MAG: pyridoxine 5'-phosphate synthase [Rhizobiales bacterium]|nr:pyridoxine 5'-phosphate synthase [Hyphomicrobiales bacterium]
MPCQLSVNVNAIAFLRNRRDLPWPSVEGLSRVALEAGAHGITVHPRPDERHIRRSDVTVLRQMLLKDWPGREFNIEGYPDERFLALCEMEKPEQVTLVPDDPSQATSDHGWDFDRDGARLSGIIARLHRSGFRVSLFVDPDPAAPAKAKAVGADRVEIYTGPYGGALTEAAMRPAFDKVVATGKAAASAGVGLNAGHDLTRENLPRLVTALPNLEEVSIGHAITSDALTFGMAETVKLFRKAIGQG